MRAAWKAALAAGLVAAVVAAVAPVPALADAPANDSEGSAIEVGALPTTRVTSIDSFTWKCAIAPDQLGDRR